MSQIILHTEFLKFYCHHCGVGTNRDKCCGSWTLCRQPLAGRSRDGGLKFGSMSGEEFDFSPYSKPPTEKMLKWLEDSSTAFDVE